MSDHEAGQHPAAVPLLEAHVAPWIRELQTHAHLRECAVAALVARVLEEIQVLHAERTRLRALVLDLLKAFDAPEQEQAAVKRRARDELTAR